MNTIRKVLDVTTYSVWVFIVDKMNSSYSVYVFIIVTCCVILSKVYLVDFCNPLKSLAFLV